MKRHLLFTLIEVVVALAILTISITSLLQLLIFSQQRIIKARDAWKHTHMLAQAAEYYLLMPLEEPPEITEDFFPYADYTVEHTVDDIDSEEIPEEYNGLVGQIPLSTMKLTLKRISTNEIIDELLIDRINYENTTSDSASN